MVDKITKVMAAPRLPMLVVAALAAMGSAPASAFQIDTGNSDVSLRWDNTVRYNAGWRLENINPHFANAFGSDETETRFDKHDMVLNRLDLLSEVDYSYQDKYGFRVSASLWSEHAYPNSTHTNPAIDAAFTGAQAVPSSYGASRQYSSFTKRYVAGSSGEFLDAFVFGNFNLGDTSLKLRVGQHTVYWGEASFTQADGIATGIAPTDGIKAQQSPGADAKETLLPLNQITAQWSLSEDWSLLGLYTLDWKSTRGSPGGTFFAASDGSGNPTQANSPVCSSTRRATCTPYLTPVTPGRNGGDFGIAARWSPGWLTGTMGFYYRRYDEKTPWAATQRDPSGATGLRLSYARDTELVGVSFARQILGFAVGVDASYRYDTALQSIGGFSVGSGGTAPVTATTAGPAIALAQTPDYHQMEGARGDTMHLVANATLSMKPSFWYDTASLSGELTYQRLQRVTRNENLHNSVDYACKFGYGPTRLTAGARGKTDGCSTKDALGMMVVFVPQWPQPFPGWSVMMPMTFSYGIRGNAPALGGTTEAAYRWSIGLTGTYQSRYEFALSVNDSYQKYKTAAATVNNGLPGEQVFSTGMGSTPSQNSHRWLSLRFKTAF